MAKDGHLEIRLSGERAASAIAVGKVLTAMDGLVDAVASEMGIDPDSFTLQVGRMRWICDGCGCERTEQSRGWLKYRGLDYCPACRKLAHNYNLDELGFIEEEDK